MKTTNEKRADYLRSFPPHERNLAATQWDRRERLPAEQQAGALDTLWLDDVGDDAVLEVVGSPAVGFRARLVFEDCPDANRSSDLVAKFADVKQAAESLWQC